MWGGGGLEASVNSLLYVSCERVLSRNVLLATGHNEQKLNVVFGSANRITVT